MAIYPYVYLLGSLFFLAVLCAILAARRDLRRQALATALLFLPAGPIVEIAYFRDYWSPPSVLAVSVLGHRILFEDMVFAFAAVGLMSVFLDFVAHRTPFPRIAKPRLFSAVVMSVAFVGLLVALPLLTGINSMVLGTILPLLLWAWMMSRRPDLLNSSLVNGLLCAGCALGFYLVYLRILPGDYLGHVWKLSTDRASFSLLGTRIPAPEIGWAFATSLYFGALYKFAAGSGRPTSKTRRSETRPRGDHPPVATKRPPEVPNTRSRHKTPEGDAEISQLVSNAESRVLGTGLQVWIERHLFGRVSNAATAAATALAIYLVLQAIVLLLLIATGYPVTAYLATPAVTGPALAAVSLWVLRHCLRITVKTLEAVVPPGSVPAEGRACFERFLSTTTRFWPQMGLSVLGAVAAAVLTYGFRTQIHFSYQHNAATFLGFAMFIAVACQGAYWGLVSCLATRYLRNTGAEEFAPDPLCPSATPILVFASRVLSAYLRCIAIVITLCIISYFAASPDFHSLGSLGLGLLMVSIYIVTVSIFAYTQLNLWRIVRAAKMRSLDHIRAKAKALFATLSSLDPAQTGELQQLMDLHEAVRATPNTLVRVSSILTVVGALLVQTLGAIPGILSLLAKRGM